MADVKTYNPKQVTISLGNHMVSGYAEESFIAIEPVGNGTTSKTGCDGEVGRSVDPNNQRRVKISLTQFSKSNAWLRQKWAQDKETGEGIFPILIKDLSGSFIFSAESAWVEQVPSIGRGREFVNQDWQICTADSKETE